MFVFVLCADSQFRSMKTTVLSPFLTEWIYFAFTFTNVFHIKSFNVKCNSVYGSIRKRILVAIVTNTGWPRETVIICSKADLKFQLVWNSNDKDVQPSR